MSAVLKHAHGAIRTLSATDEQESGRPSEIEQLIATLAERDQQLADRDRRMARLRDDAETARKRAEDIGYTRGLKEAENREEDRLAKLSEAISLATARLDKALADTEAQAVVIAQACLDMLLGDDRDHPERVRQIIRTQLARIDRGSLVTLTVSHIDFPDEAARLALSQRHALCDAALITDGNAPSGTCFFQLTLGHIDASLDRQWGRLREVLAAATMKESVA